MKYASVGGRDGGEGALNVHPMYIVFKHFNDGS